MSKKNKEKTIESDEMPSTGLSMLVNASSIVSDDAILPFVPLFDTVGKVMESLYTIYDNAKYNKKMCEALLDRIEVVGQATRSLKRRKQENAAKFSSNKYYHAWVRLTHVLGSIKKFAEDITQQSVFQKHLNANAVKVAYDKNIKEFEDVCKDLQFSVYMFPEEQKEEENKQILNELNLLGWDELKNISLNVPVPTIEYSEFKDPDCGLDNIRGSNKTVIKKIYRGIDVACKQDQNIKNLKIQAEWSILLNKCPKIIYFYGLLCEGDQNGSMVFEWASYGNLKEFYTKFDIPWTTKLQFTRDIFSGLYFMHNSGILHHDVRCENILITENHEAKISNFEISRSFDGKEAMSNSYINDYIYWLAPEVIHGSRYDHKSEMFSFGMLIWELCYQKIPYEKMDLQEIREHIKNGKRETLGILTYPNSIAQELATLIKQSWKTDPMLRPSYLQFHSIIEFLCEKHISVGTSPQITPKGNSNNDITDFELNQPNSDDINSEIIFNRNDFLEEGIEAHEDREYVKAWKFFNKYADLGFSLAKYWKGYYLQNGYCGRKKPKEALKLFKAAADEGVPDAQLSYAIELIKFNNNNSKLNELILYYLAQATTGRNETAMYKLGDIYYNGKFGVKEDKEKGIELHRLAAMMNQPRSIEFLDSIEIKPFGKCKECKQDNTGLNWCKFCNGKRFQTEFDKWTSNDKEIDQYIQQMQLNANKFEEILEWIPFNKFENVQYLDEGGFGKVFKAKWLDGFIASWDHESENWNRLKQDHVCLKQLNIFDTNAFIQEIKHQLKVRGGSVIAIYGITKNPQKNNYMIVMQYAKHGNLRKMLNKRFKFLTWKEKIKILECLARGLKRIHKIGLIHKDFHPGNIVNESLTNSYITDFGLCKPISENDEKFIGVLPYMAPEMWKGNEKEYTQALDIYSFGMIMLEVFTSYPPFYNIPHNEQLIMSICKGQKPEIKCKVPLLLKEMMEKCWNIEPHNRPTSEELYRSLFCYCYEDNEVLEKQINEANELNEDFSPYNSNESKHPQVIYRSKLFSKKEKNIAILHDNLESCQVNLVIPDNYEF
ncbi:hypothetical protein Glove_330g118 [Diversispora epigaea]|uniref:Protein kinase domain-containing protein n=1 Tax=Diversispora epigaea TaxID=1348612 RepID=A0A397HPP1_9GLOM|nr:hypothetical protein Glove_330g118 [Diversispora epigaea]